MKYETDFYTYKAIQQRKLSRIAGDLDKREGSVIWTAIGPNSAVDAEIYSEIALRYNEGFADTASRPYLIRRCAEQGITPYQATRAVVEATGLVRKGEYVLEGTDKTYIADDVANPAQATAKKRGSNNHSTGRLIPTSTGATVAEITSVVVVGEDDEATEDLRQRYYDVFDFKRSFGGNVTSFQDATNDIEGVGLTKVFRAWDGPGTVKLCILDGNLDSPDAGLISTVQALIDPTINTPGDVGGLGIAPIFAKTTVTGATNKNIKITGTIQGSPFSEVKPAIEEVINAYFRELKEGWVKESIVIKINRVLLAIIGVAGVDDVTALKLNNSTGNITLSAEEIPILESVVL